MNDISSAHEFMAFVDKAKATGERPDILFTREAIPHLAGLFGMLERGLWGCLRVCLNERFMEEAPEEARKEFQHKLTSIMDNIGFARFVGAICVEESRAGFDEKALENLRGLAASALGDTLSELKDAKEFGRRMARLYMPEELKQAEADAAKKNAEFVQDFVQRMMQNAAKS